MSRATRPLLLGLAGLAATAGLAAATQHWQERARWQEAGQALYEGSRPLTARLVGHEQDLPPQATRCVNCHSGSSAIAPALTPERLTRHLPRRGGPFFRVPTEPGEFRRGGPPSRYDEASFCRLLRSGVDPAWVLLPRAMPRYTLPDRECRELWLALSTR